MQRRLNPNLFEDSPRPVADAEASFSALAAKKLGDDLATVKKTVGSLESQVDILKGQLSSMTLTMDKKIEAISKALSQLERDSREQDLQLSQKCRHLQDDMRDRKVVDGKIEMMVDRYNSSLQTFENRLSSLQKVISEKEMTLMKYNSAIEMIFKEIEKLKKS